MCLCLSFLDVSDMEWLFMILMDVEVAMKMKDAKSRREGGDWDASAAAAAAADDEVVGGESGKFSRWNTQGT